MQLSAYEKETIINFNEAEGVASVFTFNRTLQRKLARLAEERPEECRLDPDERLTDDDAAAYLVPKKWVKISPPQKQALSEEQRQALRDRLRKNLLVKASV